MLSIDKLIMQSEKEIMEIPDITDSSKEERRKYIKEKFKCISDCDNCGLCKIFKGENPEIAYIDYIEGKRSFIEISKELRK